MTNKIDIEKETKIYIPKVTNPQILTYRSYEPESVSEIQVTLNAVDTGNDAEKRR